MSVPVALAELGGQMDHFGSVAFLVTTGESAAPHAVSVTVAWQDDQLTATVGGRTSANIDLHPTVTLLWPALPGGPYALIVDGEARVDRAPEAGTEGGGLAVAIQPTGAVLHRVAGADDSLPSCVRL